MDDRGQTSLEYLYLLAFVVGLAAAVALLVNDLLAIQSRAKTKLEYYREHILGKILGCCTRRLQ